MRLLEVEDLGQATLQLVEGCIHGDVSSCSAWVSGAGERTPGDGAEPTVSQTYVTTPSSDGSHP